MTNLTKNARRALAAGALGGVLVASSTLAASADEYVGAAGNNQAAGESCTASMYDEPQQTATGEQFDPQALTAAHKTLPLNSMAKVRNNATGQEVTVRINDRGPYIQGRCIDLSTASFAAIGDPNAGLMEVTVTPA